MLNLQSSTPIVLKILALVYQRIPSEIIDAASSMKTGIVIAGAIVSGLMKFGTTPRGGLPNGILSSRGGGPIPGLGKVAKADGSDGWVCAIVGVAIWSRLDITGTA